MSFWIHVGMCRLGILFVRLNTANVLDNKGAPLGSNSAVCMNLLIVLYTACKKCTSSNNKSIVTVNFLAYFVKKFHYQKRVGI